MDIKEQIEILNEAISYSRGNGYLVPFVVETIVEDTMMLQPFLGIHINILLFNKDFLKAVFGEDTMYIDTEQFKNYQYCGFQIFLSDNRLLTFCNLYLEYNKNE